MFVDKFNSSITAFAGVALVAALTTGCGESSLKDLIDSSEPSDLSPEQISSSVKNGMTRGMTNNLDSIGEVFADSSAFSSLGALFSGSNENSFDARSSRSNHDDDELFGGFGELLGVIGDLADHSTVTNINGDIVTLDPNESEICPAAAEALDIEATNCVAVISQITLEVDVETIVNNEVVDATAAVKFGQETFLIVDFTLTSLYYEARLAGLKNFLAGVAQIEGETADLPDTMTGAIRLAATISGQDAGAITLSIPTAVNLANTSPQTAINIAATAKLFELAVNGNNETLSFEIDINPIDLLFTDSDSIGSFPVHLTMDGLSGQLQLDDDILTVTGATLNALTIEVDGVEAVTAALSELDFTLDGSGNFPVIALAKVLNFDLSMKNERGIFEDEFESTDPNQQITAALDADSGTTLTILDDDFTQVTGGIASIVVNSPDGDLNIQIADGLCLDDSGDEPVEANCPTAN
jgi:hypothetical protein